MIANHILESIDTHTAGNPTRNLVAGVPSIFGNSMAEKMQYAMENLDWIRTCTMLEPRGHNNMSGTIWTEPCHPEAHMGVLFLDAGGFMPMCGHSTIGSITAMLESGRIPIQEAEQKVNIDTAAGLVRAVASIEDNRVTKVTFRNIPSFLYAEGEVEVEGYGKVPYDVAYGGTTFAITDASHFDLDLRSGNLAKITHCAHLFREAVRSVVKFQHPEQPSINVITHVIFNTKPDDPKASDRNTVIFLPSFIDRSPCGTGTAARVASLFAKGKLELNKNFIYESVIGTQFEARIVEPVSVGGYKGGIPEISGTAYITGLHKFLLNPYDNLSHGFRLD